MVEKTLPECWLQTKLGKIVNYGKTSKVEFKDVSDETWVLELEDILKNSSKISRKPRASERHFKSTKNSFQKGDVLYGKLRPYLNKVVKADEKGVCSTEIVPLNAEPFVENEYLFNWLKSYEFLDYVKKVSYGVNMPRLGTKDGLAAPFILPPLAEQKVIADKLDTLLAQVESTKSRLERIPTILKRFRQSVLSSAVSGKLTEDWRKEKIYTQTSGNFPIPSSWTFAKIEDLADVKGGKRLPKGESLVPFDTGYPYIRAGQLKLGTVIRDEQLFLEEHVQKQISRYTVNEGDAYITIVGACIGDAGLIPSEYDGANLTENAAKICNLNQRLSSSFLSLWLRGEHLQKIIQFETKSAAQGKLALKRIRNLPIPIPPKEEQQEIVQRVETLFAYADRIESQTTAALDRVNNLAQSILAKAFRGELTANWRTANPDLISGENSAAALLARIQSERAVQQSVKKKRRKP